MRIVHASLLFLALALFVLSTHGEARSLMQDMVLGKPASVPISSGEVSQANMDAGVPPGRNCVASGMHCSSSSQCCSKGCDAAFFRCQ